MEDQTGQIDNGELYKQIEERIDRLKDRWMDGWTGRAQVE